MRLLPIALLGLVAACDGVDGRDTSTAADLAVEADLRKGLCDDPSPAAGSVCPVAVTGNVVDENGAPASSLLITVCADQCYYGKTSADGSFAVSTTRIVPDRYALEIHGRPDHASFYAALPMLDGNHQASFVASLPLVSLPPNGPAMLADGSAQTLTSDDLTLELPANTKVVFSIEDGDADRQRLRVVHTTPSALPFVDAASPPAALYACSPFEVAFDKKVPLRLSNRAALPAGAAVEILSLGGLVNGKPPAGRLTRAALAHVSSDGSRIETDAGEGLVELTWLAIRKL